MALAKKKAPEPETKKTSKQPEGDPSFYKTIPALARYIDRIVAEQLSFRKFMIKDHVGHYHTERSFIRIMDDFSIRCTTKEHEPTKEEAEAIKAALANVKFPVSITVKHINDLKVPMRPGQVGQTFFTFHDRQKKNEIVMVQERCDWSDKPKQYFAWSKFSDGKWRPMEPDGLLPFWKPVTDRKMNQVMIHEGAKAADFVDRLVNDPEMADELAKHPWGDILRQYEHWGMIGGALVAHRSDYASLAHKKPTEVVYICDNDPQGKSVPQEFSRHYGGKKMQAVMFDTRWPGSWDLADPMPKNELLWTPSGHYRGPPLEALMRSCTWATQYVPTKAGKTVIKITDDFKKEWYHSVTPEVFIHEKNVQVIRTENEFNNWVRPFSDVANTAAVLKQDAASKTAIVSYNPAMPSGIYGDTGAGAYINTYCPPSIDKKKGKVDLFIEYMEHLLPVDEDRHEVMKWVATLLAKPEIKMLYGLLLISETQGVGKSTLGEKILDPLIGKLNVSYPSENEITDSNFNYWLAHRRLAIVHEIYAGHSSKAYNRLKSIITDKYITVSKKYQANYEIENWVHIFACSNSMRALQLPNDDRRWLIPKVTEDKKPPAFWRKFNLWLWNDHGLEKIFNWAHEFVKQHGHVENGEEAPMTEVKNQMVLEGMSPGCLLVANFLRALKEKYDQKSFFILDTHLQQLIIDQLHEGKQPQFLEKPLTLRKIAKGFGYAVGETRAFIREWGTLSVGPRVIFSDQNDVLITPGELIKAGKMPLDVGKEFNELNGI